MLDTKQSQPYSLAAAGVSLLSNSNNALTCIINSLLGSTCEVHSYSTAQEFAHLVRKPGVNRHYEKGRRTDISAYMKLLHATRQMIRNTCRVWCEIERDKQSGVCSGFHEVVPVIYNASALYFGNRRDCLFQLLR
jgi:hypothetical protein